MGILRTRPFAIALVIAALAACATAPQASLYTRLGGKPAIDAVVSDMVNRSAKDPRTKRTFADVKLARLKASIADQLCQATGGPCVYKGDSMKLSHKGLGITTDEFNGLVANLIAAMDAAGVGATEKNEVLAALGPMSKDIVEKP
jgi:hemoglobin